MNPDKIVRNHSNTPNDISKGIVEKNSCIGDVQKTIFPKRQKPRPGEVPKSDGFGEE